MLMEHERAVEALLTAPMTGEPQPITLEIDGQRVYAMYHPPTGEPPLGPRVAVLVLEQLGPHRMNLRLTRALAAAGYPVLAVDFRGRGESEGEGDPYGQRHMVSDDMIADARAALAELRRLAAPDRVVLFGSCQAGYAAAYCAVRDEVDGLILAGTIIFDDFFREHFRGILPGMPRTSDVPTLDMFETLAPWQGPLLLVQGGSDPYIEHTRLLELAEHWEGKAPGRQVELRIVDGGDHTFSSHPREQVLIREAVTWLERRYGPGYPRAWQGPPPTMALPGRPERDDRPAAQVPLLTTGALLHPPGAGDDGDQLGWRMELPDGRAFALTEALRRLVSLVDGHRTVGEIAARLTEQMERTVSAEQISTLLHERLAPLGVLEPDARGEGGEDESGMTDILIRCYQPNSDRVRALLDNLTRVTTSPYNIIFVAGKRSCVRNQNLALDRARTRYAVFLDDDILLTEGWLERLRETMDRTGAGAVSARQLRMDGSPLASAAAVAKGEIAEICFGGACFMFRNDLGLRFDEQFVRSQWDDFDFIFQFYELGYKCYVDGRVEFNHHADPKHCLDQNYHYFVQKWTQKGLYRGLMFCRYPNGHRGYLPNFGA
jgi:dienelactone hydrolase